MTKPLTVYKASAGSGKTFRLSVEYIKLLIENPLIYKQILAVTFTNKATEEMKTRILSQLYGISRGLDDSEAYATRVSKELGIDREQVKKQAGRALHLLLHNYSYFRVETIDSFFQSVLRNLARELDLTANLRISLNDKQVEELAVDQLIDNLTSTDQMLQWLLRYIMDNISEDHSWNVIGQIKKFGRTIFRDYYKQESGQLHIAEQEKDFFERYTKTLREHQTQAKAQMQKYGEQFFEALHAAGVDEEALPYGKGGIAGFFQKLKEGKLEPETTNTRIKDCQLKPENWCKKGHQQRELICHLAETTLIPLLNQALEDQPRQWRRYMSATLTLRHLSELRLLSSIEDKVHELNESANRFLLSNTQQLLHDLIDDSDSPFIFEKIGTQLEHIMIDEFQDTSTLQWKNFKVLLEETMSHQGSSSLVVGDVKQSIYRWRSGDWQLLANIDKAFNHVNPDIQSLDTNFRSDRRIVSFNNAFFIEAARQEGVTAYGEDKDIAQKVQERKGNEGMVRIALLPQKDYQEETLKLLTEQIDALLNDGVAPSDIAILLRTNKHIPLIANHLMALRPEIPVVSDEAFRLDASPAVIIIIQALRFLSCPEDVIAEAFLKKAYSGRLDGQLPDDFDSNLLQMPLYDLTERLYGMFHLYEMKGQSAYLCAFYDYIASYVNDNTTDVDAFLKEWDETLCEKTIQSPDVNGIRLISIHKSKGLEFPVVLVPFCDWRLEMSDILWCRPQEEPYNQLPIAAIDYSQKNMKGTIYENDYEKEHAQMTVDNLNLLYVAFTRAANRLYVYGRRKDKTRRSALIEQVLPVITPQLEGAVISGETDDEAPLLFSYGESGQSGSSGNSGLSGTSGSSNHSKTSDNPFLQTPTPLDINIGVFTQKVAFRQSNRSIAFAQADDEQQSQQNAYIQLGSVLHEVFSTIRTTADIDEALRRMELEGIIYNNDVTPAHIKDMIRKRLADPRVADWFSPRWTLFNECTILNRDPVTDKVYERRPDRVLVNDNETIVIDFKFGKENEEYLDQVRLYMTLLREMGHHNVKGFLWFVYSNKIVEVK